jgi:hypothetical protein
VFVIASRHTPARIVQLRFVKITAQATRQIGMERVSQPFPFIIALAIRLRESVGMTAQFYTV